MLVTYIFSPISIVGTLLINRKNINGYYFWAVSNLSFLIYNLIIKDYGSSILFGSNFIFCIDGFIRWRKDNKKIRNKC